jgi:uncharacterized membrane protein YhiD involved in acid resistance
MPELFFSLNPLEMTGAAITLCTVTSLLAGVITATAYTFHQSSNRNFLITLTLLPMIVQSIIMLVNGHVGTGLAVLGAFSLVRFRSIPGTSKEITSIFLAMALGLATGTGHLWYAVIFAIVINGLLVFFSAVGFTKMENQVRKLKVVIPENKDYTGIFDDLFVEYTKHSRLERVKTVNLGSLFELYYIIVFKDNKKEKEFIDRVRARNGNLEISCGRAVETREEL